MLKLLINSFNKSRQKSRVSRIERMISMLPALSDRELLEWFSHSEGDIRFDRNNNEDIDLNTEIAKELDKRGLVA